MRLARLYEEIQQAESFLEDALEESGLDYCGMRNDTYDNSLELDQVGNDERLNEAQQRLIYDQGFGKCFVNHKNGWETHYTWGKVYEVQKGWRRKWVGDAQNGHWEISYWPEGWGEDIRGWQARGYMVVVGE